MLQKRFFVKKYFFNVFICLYLKITNVVISWRRLMRLIVINAVIIVIFINIIIIIIIIIIITLNSLFKTCSLQFRKRYSSIYANLQEKKIIKLHK